MNSIQCITFINILAKGKGSGGVKTAKLYAWVALQSLPEEMVISPCLLDFLEKALETIPITPIERNYTGKYSPHMHSNFRSYFIEVLTAIIHCYIFLYKTKNWRRTREVSSFLFAGRESKLWRSHIIFSRLQLDSDNTNDCMSYINVFLVLDSLHGMV